MEHIPPVPILFLLLGIFNKGLAAVIQTQQTVLAAVGEDAPLSCQLLETKDVQQVTWQKVLEKTERNIGSYSQYFGETVNDGFKDKVQFTEAGLQKNSIVIRNVTEDDAGCYLCLFNTYPDGALTAATCLTVYELHGPFINIRNSPPWSVVTCSDTGQSAPMVTLTVLHQNLSFSHYNTSREINTNGTVTVTTTALLSALSSTQVGCSVSVDSAALRERLVTVPGLKKMPDYEFKKQSNLRPDESQEAKDLKIPLILGIVAGIVLTCCGVAIIALWRHKNVKNRDDENNKTSPRQEPMGRNMTPLMKLTNEVKQRLSTKKSPESNNLKTLPSAAKKLIFCR
ncbi:OX-2 membrane glycoprotein-like [Poecilia reticulata]|uniref:OX-2 membrane glycoprotein-like n=1 Tax=Poecilia reticulata TaxID=8081 RepID=UPI0004A27AA3|nr:PREDICTED: OX-2 membrane glycoprotein-like [Poecilia reticulata]